LPRGTTLIRRRAGNLSGAPSNDAACSANGEPTRGD